MKIRNIELRDRDEWIRMRNILYPSSNNDHRHYIDTFFVEGGVAITEVFVVERPDGKLGGFLEIFIRNYAEGSRSSAVPFVESWYLDEDLRSGSIGNLLLEAAESWLMDQGFTELASQAELEDLDSINRYRSSGFIEVERAVNFIKKLK